MTEFIQGFFLQASLILALGAQNLFVIETGLIKRRHLLVATLCALCDAVLISIGVLGAGTVFVRHPSLKILFGILGVTFLAVYGVKKIIPKPENDQTLLQPLQASSVSAIIATTLAMSLLNPHVYLDTVVLIGGYATQFVDPFDRLRFGGGASFCSLVWFFALAVLAGRMSGLLRHPQALRRVNTVSGGILVLLSLKLGWEIRQWIALGGL